MQCPLAGIGLLLWNSPKKSFQPCLAYRQIIRAKRLMRGRICKITFGVLLNRAVLKTSIHQLYVNFVNGRSEHFGLNGNRRDGR
jgi:hypothetical protein